LEIVVKIYKLLHTLLNIRRRYGIRSATLSLPLALRSSQAISRIE
jgi:hypothetical protein